MAGERARSRLRSSFRDTTRTRDEREVHREGYESLDFEKKYVSRSLSDRGRR